MGMIERLIFLLFSNPYVLGYLVMAGIIYYGLLGGESLPYKKGTRRNLLLVSLLFWWGVLATEVWDRYTGKARSLVFFPSETPSVKRCKKCSAALKVDANFCGRCGKEV